MPAFVLVATLLWISCAEAPESPPSALESPADHEGTRSMVRRLKLLADDSPPMSNPYMNREHLELLRTLDRPDDPIAATQHDVALAQEMLRAGDSVEAAALFAEALKEIEANAGEHPEGLARRIREVLVIAHLRVGEQQNCLERHSSDSCLLPIREGGVHNVQDGSRAALELLDALLRERPDDLMMRWLYNLAAMTVGEYPDGVPEVWLIPPEAFESEADIGRFPDVAPQTGLDTISLAGGSVTEDFNRDGLLDVMVSSWGFRNQLRLYLAEVDAEDQVRWIERTSESGLDGLTGGLNLVQADYDDDGDIDVLVLRGAWRRQYGRFPNSLLENDGEGRFRDVTEEVGLLSFHPAQVAAWADYDLDGDLDLFIGNESPPDEPHPSELFRNDGGRFVNVAGEAGVATHGVVKGAVWGDVDDDGDPDLYVSRIRQKNQLFLNLGPQQGFRFEEIAASVGVTEPIDSFPAWFFDYDNDGRLDLFVAGYAGNFLDAQSFQTVADILGERIGDDVTPRLYRNVSQTGAVRFEDVTRSVGLDHAMLVMGANFGDLDNDGFLDMYLGTGAPDYKVLVPNKMFRNDAGRVFQDVTTSAGVGHLQKGHGVSFADLDNDGDQDVIAVMGGAFSGDVYQNAFFANPGHGNRWIVLRLVGETSNRSAIGARVRLTALLEDDSRREIHQIVSSGGSFGASSLQLETGLGDAVALPEVEIWWPGGERQIYRDLPLDRFVVLTQNDPQIETLDVKALRLPEHSASHPHH